MGDLWDIVLLYIIINIFSFFFLTWPKGYCVLSRNEAKVKSA